jgi:hypothetical protein
MAQQKYLLNKNCIDPTFIHLMNQEIDSMSYQDSMILFLTRDKLKNQRFYELLKTNSMINQYLNNDSYVVIRCVKNGLNKAAYYPHFDNYSETVMVPIKMPQTFPDGALLMWENTRGLPSNSIINAIQKVFFQNPIIKTILLKFFRGKFHKVPVVPGDIAIFNGMTNLHFNIEALQERRTILIHNHQPFRNSLFVKASERLSQLFFG